MGNLLDRFLLAFGITGTRHFSPRPILPPSRVIVVAAPVNTNLPVVLGIVAGLSSGGIL